MKNADKRDSRVWTRIAGSLLFLVVFGPAAAQVEIRIGHGFAAEEQLWLMSAKPEVAPNSGKA